MLVTFTSIAFGGDAIARHEGKAIFVPLAMPGDMAEIEIIADRGRFARGRIVRLIEPAAERVVPRCKHYGVCGGCHWQHIAYAKQLEYKTQIVRDQLQRIGGLSEPLVHPTLGMDEFHDRWEKRGNQHDDFPTGYFATPANAVFDYDRSNGIATNQYDFIGTVAHELSEVMGRNLEDNTLFIGSNPSVTPLDLFHYSAANTRSFALGGYFSFDDGVTHLDPFNFLNDGSDPGDWAPGAGNDSFLNESGSGVYNNISITDLRLMDVRGTVPLRSFAEHPAKVGELQEIGTKRRYLSLRPQADVHMLQAVVVDLHRQLRSLDLERGQQLVLALECLHGRYGLLHPPEDDARALALDAVGTWTRLDGSGDVDVEGRLIGGCVETRCNLTGPAYFDVSAFARTEAADGLLVYVEAGGDDAFTICRNLHGMRLAGVFDAANAVEYGLAASVYTRDVRAIFQFVERVDVGIAHVNQPTLGGEVHLPFGGVKASGIGPHEQGREAIDFFTKVKSVYINYA